MAVSQFWILWVLKSNDNNQIEHTYHPLHTVVTTKHPHVMRPKKMIKSEPVKEGNSHAERVGESGAEAGGELLRSRHLEEGRACSLTADLEQHGDSIALPSV